jgi:hypothetical protein
MFGAAAVADKRPFSWLGLLKGLLLLPFVAALWTVRCVFRVRLRRRRRTAPQAVTQTL